MDNENYNRSLRIISPVLRKTRKVSIIIIKKTENNWLLPVGDDSELAMVPVDGMEWEPNSSTATTTSQQVLRRCSEDELSFWCESCTQWPGSVRHWPFYKGSCEVVRGALEGTPSPGTTAGGPMAARGWSSNVGGLGGG